MRQNSYLDAAAFHRFVVERISYIFFQRIVSPVVLFAPEILRLSQGKKTN